MNVEFTLTGVKTAVHLAGVKRGVSWERDTACFKGNWMHRPREEQKGYCSTHHHVFVMLV